MRGQSYNVTRVINRGDYIKKKGKEKRKKRLAKNPRSLTLGARRRRRTLRTAINVG